MLIVEARTRRGPVVPMLSVVVPTIGRPTLDATLTSLAPQVAAEDEVIVVGDGHRPEAERIVAGHAALPIRYFEIPRSGNSGNSARRAAIDVARGTHLTFMDDDDVYTLDALAAIREAIRQWPRSALIFRMDRYGTVLWTDHAMIYGNVGTPMLVAPNLPDRLGDWAPQGTDFEFISGTARLLGDVRWIDHVVAVVRPHVPR